MRSVSPSARAETRRAPAFSAQIAARWLFPAPSGPISASTRSAQSGQRSIMASAASFERADEKIVAREALRVRQRERELTRNIHGTRSGSVRLTREADRTARRLAGIERAFEISPQREAHEHADHGGERHRDQQSDEAEQIAEREQREHQPHRMQPDALADQLRRQHVAFEELADEEDAEHDQDRRVFGPELRDRDAAREHQPGHRPDIGNERDDPGDEPDQQPEAQAA